MIEILQGLIYQRPRNYSNIKDFWVKRAGLQRNLHIHLNCFPLFEQKGKCGARIVEYVVRQLQYSTAYLSAIIGRARTAPKSYTLLWVRTDLLSY